MILKNKFINRKFLVGLICILFLALSAFLITDGYFNLNRDIKLYSAERMDVIDYRMTSLLSEINIFPQYIGDDLVFLSKLSSLKKIIFREEKAEDSPLEDLENDFLEFLKQSDSYYQLGYIDEEGNEVVKVEFNGNVYRIVPKENLENKKNVDYFNKTIEFDYREVFISKINLNMKGGEIESRNNEYVPIILSAIPVFTDNMKKTGVIFLSYYVDYFLEDIRRSQREGEEVFLVNNEGFYLAHENREKEFGFVFGNEESIYNDYPGISKEILFDYNKRKFETDDLIFSFRYLYPTAGDFWIHKGSEKVFGENPEENYFWVLVIISDKNEVNKTIDGLNKEYIYFLLFSGLIVLIIILLVFIAVFRGFEDKILVGEKMKLEKRDLAFGFLFAIIFAIVYYFFMVFLFGWKQIFNHYMIFPNLICMTIAIIIFIYTFKLTSSPMKKFAIYGSSFLIIGELIKIFLREYDKISFFNDFYWVITGIIINSGFLFLLASFRRGVK